MTGAAAAAAGALLRQYPAHVHALRAHHLFQAHYRDWGQFTYARCVFIIHNMAHQGRGPFDETSNLELNDAYKEMFRCACTQAYPSEY